MEGLDCTRPLSLYIHVPFCHSKCGYCAFYSLPAPSEEAIACWLERILRELKEFEPVETCETIYLGGGTPTLPEPRMLERFFEALYDREHTIGHAYFMPLKVKSDTEKIGMKKANFLYQCGINITPNRR